MIEIYESGRSGRPAGSRNGASANQPARELACSGEGNRTWLILRWTGGYFIADPKTDTEIRRPDELDTCTLKRLPNLLDGIKVGFDTALRAFQPTYGRKRQPGLLGKLFLPPSEEGAGCLDLSGVNEHLCPSIPSGNPVIFN
jgi:hypothetical protein